MAGIPSRSTLAALALEVFVSCSYRQQNLLAIKVQYIAESTFFNLVLGIRQDGKELNKGLVGCHREILLHQLSSHFLEGRKDKHWILSGSHGEVLKSLMKGLCCGDGPRVVP